MKKYFLCLLLLLVFVSGCSKNSLSKLSISELNSKLNSKDSFILYFTSKDNTSLEEKLNKVLNNNNLKGYKIDASKLSEEEKLALQLKIDYTEPSIVFIINGQDPSKLSHVTDTNMTTKQIEQRLIDMNFIK